MAISFVSDASAQDSSGTSINTGEPAGAQDGDFMLFAGHINSNTNDGDWNVPADFTSLIVKDETAGTPDNQIIVAYKIRSGGAGSGYNFGYSGAAKPMAGVILCYRGVDPVTPFDVTYVEADHYVVYTNGANGAAKAITTVTNGAEVVLFQFMNQSISGPVGMPSGYTERESIQMTASGRGMTSCSKNIAVAGLETPGAWTHTDTNGNTDPSNITLALRPFVVAGYVNPFIGKLGRPFRGKL